VTSESSILELFDIAQLVYLRRFHPTDPHLPIVCGPFQLVLRQEYNVHIWQGTTALVCRI
jgi:hypothetical protein